MKSRLLDLRVLASALALVASAVASATVTFNFDYSSDVNVGFNDSTLGAIRRAALAQAAGYVSAVLGSSYTTTLTFAVNGHLTGNGTLASAGSNFNTPVPVGTFGDRGDVMTKILTNVDPGGSQPDGTVNWNFASYDWGYSTVTNTQYDFLSTAIHELTHAIGFASDISQAGTTYSGVSNVWAPFDRYVADSTGNLINGAGMLAQSRWNAASVGGSTLLFNGLHSVAANGGNVVHLYSPTTYEPGSSTSHLDDATYSEATYIMDAQTPPGVGPRVYTPLEIGFLQDLGYTNAQAVPEPGTMAALALGALAVLKRRKKSA